MDIFYILLGMWLASDEEERSSSLGALGRLLGGILLFALFCVGYFLYWEAPQRHLAALRGYLPWALGGIALFTFVIPLLDRVRHDLLAKLLLYPCLAANYVCGFFTLMYLFVIKLNLTDALSGLLDSYAEWTMGLANEEMVWYLGLILVLLGFVLLVVGEVILFMVLLLFPLLTLVLYGYAQYGVWRALGLISDARTPAGSASSPTARALK